MSASDPRPTSRRQWSILILAISVLVVSLAIALAKSRSEAVLPPTQYAAHEEFNSGQPLADVATMIASLQMKLRARPDDVAGWRMLGWSLRETGRSAESIDAYRQALSLEPRDAPTWSALAEAQLLSGDRAGASVSANRALAVAPGDPAALALIGELRTLPDDRSRRASPEAFASTAAPSLAAPAEQEAMIGQMVARLAARLADNPRDEEGWARLVRSYRVLGDTAAADEALARGLAAFADDPAAQARMRAERSAV